MKITTNYHTHNELCQHATGTIEEYTLRAIELGYKEIGMSDHMPIIDELKSQIISRRMDFDAYYNKYLPQLKEVVDKYSDKIKIYRGLEVEYFEEMLDYIDEYYNELDYLILGQHYIKYQGNYYSIYSSLTIEMINVYKDTVIAAMKTNKFTILAHPDVFLWSQRQWTEEHEKISREIIEAAIKYDVYLEINSNGIRNAKLKNKYTTYQDENITRIDYSYPNKQFFKIAKELNAKIILNEDVHKVEYLSDEATYETLELAKSLGIEPIKSIKFKK